MPTLDLYHGANAEKMLFNVMNGALTADSEGKIFFAQHEWRNCLMHGTERSTRESYVVKVTVDFPAEVRVERTPVHGNSDAVILHLEPGARVSAKFLEMYVRSGKVGSFEMKIVTGPAIQPYLMNARGR
ncbi:MAG TPA: hypothetical protein VLI65_04700 [Pyrinomonadaceae bacterium]|nr:hypothetical protein [Pyrinomonadaceae bacterium]